MGKFSTQSKRNNYVEFDCWLIHHTEKAFLVSTDEEETDKQWIPKDSCDFEEDAIPDKLPAVTTLLVKEHMLLKKGLI